MAQKELRMQNQLAAERKRSSQALEREKLKTHKAAAAQQEQRARKQVAQRNAAQIAATYIRKMEVKRQNTAAAKKQSRKHAAQLERQAGQVAALQKENKQLAANQDPTSAALQRASRSLQRQEVKTRPVEDLQKELKALQKKHKKLEEYARKLWAALQTRNKELAEANGSIGAWENAFADQQEANKNKLTLRCPTEDIKKWGKSARTPYPAGVEELIMQLAINDAPAAKIGSYMRYCFGALFAEDTSFIPTPSASTAARLRQGLLNLSNLVAVIKLMNSTAAF
jgi:chromosome segregation ATPase